MARTSSALVEQIWQQDTNVSNFGPFIIAANIVVTNAFANKSVDASILKEIERWLSAHFATVLEPSVLEEEHDEAKLKYALPKMGDGLQASMYGKMALSLDPVGALLEIGKRSATIEAIGGP